ncbi:hypothetical protein CASFOL_037862 [Castilleja foliolosa]|uniref:Bifunctional inhibitor/plant lipid transfer protein/seed storage helical domain-containing protein n=1 Tax=Castilleja foliolosa TaxID=1961234 RepID=A0ABD3BJC0_9LAMI
MATSYSVLVLFIVILFYVGHSQGQGGGGDPMACVQKLLPCQPYLKGSPSPPATCCVPLNQILTTDLHCLCTVFSDPALLKSLNVTQHDAINLANSCGAHADSSLCKPAAAPSPSTQTAPSTNNTTGPSTNSKFGNEPTSE